MTEMKPVINIIFKGHRIVGVGSTIFWIPPKETFHEFLIRFLKKTIGSWWYKKEIEKLEPQRHVIAKWYIEYCEWQKQNTTNENKIEGGWSALPSGGTWALLTLAYDLYCLSHCMCLPKDLVERLRDINQFQGARYEIAVAATFARADYKIGYLKIKDDKSCEFIAIHKEREEKIGVEVKSRHRPGVLHHNGERQSIDEVKSGISRLLNQAIEQKPKDIPFVISIDLNLPPSSGATLDDKKWLDDLKQALSNIGDISSDKPEKFTVLFITNYSYHYESNQPIDTGKYAADTVTIIPKHLTHPFKNPQTLRELMAAVNTYGDVPYDWNNTSKGEFMKMRNPKITALLTCGLIEMQDRFLRLTHVGHTIYSKSGSGTVDLWVYVEGHWFPPGIHQLKIAIFNEQGSLVSNPPPLDVTVPANGVFESKLLLEKHIPYKKGEYEIHASIAGAEQAITQVFMV